MFAAMVAAMTHCGRTPCLSNPDRTFAHARLVEVLGEAGETIFITMERVDGTTLRARMADARLPMREVLRFSVELGGAGQRS